MSNSSLTPDIRHLAPGMATLPDCMAPDGADPCKGFHEATDEIAKLREMLAMCANAIGDALRGSTSLMEVDLDAVLETYGIIEWKTRPEGEMPDRDQFDGHEDVEPGDPYWTTTDRFREISKLVKPWRKAAPQR
jgi:hypothetical protein